jgi:Tfp pilus assembly protein PilN
MLCGGIVAGGIILLVPSVMGIIDAREAGQRRLETTRQLLEHQEGVAAEQNLLALQDKIQLIDSMEAHTSVYATIENLVRLLPPGISVQTLAWRRDGDGMFVDVAGSADTRDTLIALGDALQNSGLFVDTVIPVESLAPQTNLQFKLALTMKTKD